MIACDGYSERRLEWAVACRHVVDDSCNAMENGFVVETVWIPIGDTFQRAYLEEWHLVDDGSKRDSGDLHTSPNTTESAKPLMSGSSDVTFKQGKPWDTSSAPKSPWQAVGEFDAPTWKLSGTQGTSAFREKSEASLPHQKRVCNRIHPKQRSPLLERLKLPYPDDIMSLCGRRLVHTRWFLLRGVKADVNTILERHAVDIRKALAEFREASARRHDTSAQEYHSRQQRA